MTTQIWSRRKLSPTVKTEKLPRAVKKHLKTLKMQQRVKLMPRKQKMQTQMPMPVIMPMPEMMKQERRLR